MAKKLHRHEGTVSCLSTDSVSYAVAAEQLAEVVRKLSESSTLEATVEIARHAARTLTGADGATFVLRDGDRCHYVDEDAISPLWKGQRFPMSQCISGWVMLHGEAVFIADIYKDSRIPQDAYRSTFVKSLLMVPIRHNDPLGAIGNYWADHHEVSLRETWVLQNLADATAAALERVL